MAIARKDLLTIYKAISALETAYNVTLSQEKKTDNFGYWDCVQKSQDILEKCLISGEMINESFQEFKKGDKMAFLELPKVFQDQILSLASYKAEMEGMYSDDERIFKGIGFYKEGEGKGYCGWIKTIDGMYYIGNNGKISKEIKED